MKFHDVITMLFICSMQVSFGHNSLGETRPAQPEIELAIGKVEIDVAKIRFELNIRNKGKSSIFIATDPSRVDGSKGFYVSSPHGDGEIKLESRVFGPDRPSPYSDKTSVRLKKLVHDEEFVEIVELAFPVTETVPPVDYNYNRKNISLQDLETIEVSIGYFYEDEGVNEILQYKQKGWFLTGFEMIRHGDNRGKLLYETQKIVTTKINVRASQ